MAKSILKKISEALSKIDRPGSFCVSGSVPAVLPGLEVKGLGTDRLASHRDPGRGVEEALRSSPYGKGEETLVDTSVRRVWRMEPDHFALTNPEWQRFIKQTVGKVQEELGLERQKLACSSLRSAAL